MSEISNKVSYRISRDNHIKGKTKIALKFCLTNKILMSLCGVNLKELAFYKNIARSLCFVHFSR